MNQLCAYLNVLFFLLWSVALAKDWHYTGTHSAEEWAAEVNAQCGGNRQSPVAIYAEDVVVNRTLPELRFSGYNRKLAKNSLIVVNNGHSFAVHIENTHPDYVFNLTGGGLPTWYKLIGFHFHWAHDNHKGMEHVIGGYDYPLVAHFVHTREGIDSDMATVTPDGFAVTSVFYKLAPKDQLELKKLSDHLREVSIQGETEPLPETFVLRGLLPKDTSNFFRYHGSLTTPPCAETVIWSLLVQPSFVSESQLEAFRSLKTWEGILDHNFRPVQPLNGRKVHVRSEVGITARFKKSKENIHLDEPGRVMDKDGGTVKYYCDHGSIICQSCTMDSSNNRYCRRYTDTVYKSARTCLRKSKCKTAFVPYLD